MSESFQTNGQSEGGKYIDSFGEWLQCYSDIQVLYFIFCTVTVKHAPFLKTSSINSMVKKPSPKPDSPSARDVSSGLLFFYFILFYFFFYWFQTKITIQT